MGAVEEPEVPLRERLWNERSTANSCENAGVYRLLWVNHRDDLTPVIRPIVTRI